MIGMNAGGKPTTLFQPLTFPSSGPGPVLVTNDYRRREWSGQDRPGAGRSEGVCLAGAGGGGEVSKDRPRKQGGDKW